MTMVSTYAFFSVILVISTISSFPLAEILYHIYLFVGMIPKTFPNFLLGWIAEVNAPD